MKKIIHVDMDCFYAAVEMRDRPELVGQPIAIGGISESGRGVLCTANYEARKFGVGAAQPTALALKKCPKLVLIKPDFKKYKAVSSQVFDIFREYTDLVQGLSLDEAYLDVSECQDFENYAVKIAKDIRAKIYEETKVTASAGISNSKLLAKIASDLNKPNGQFCIPPWEIENFMPHLPVKKLMGVGKVTQEKMRSLGIITCGDLQNYNQLELNNMFGNFGTTLYNYCRGIDNRDVNTGGERKSVSCEHTFSTDIVKMEKLLEILDDVYDELEYRLEKHEDRKIKSIFVKIKYNDFKQTTIETACSALDKEILFDLFKQRFSERVHPLRLLGMGVRFVSHESPKDQLIMEF